MKHFMVGDLPPSHTGGIELTALISLIVAGIVLLAMILIGGYFGVIQ